MSKGFENLTKEEVLEQFAKLARTCRKLEAMGKLHSGCNFSIRDGKIEAEPILTDLPDRELLAESVNKMLSYFQQFRYLLGRHFDLDSNEWNGTRIGQMLHHIEKNFRQEANKIQEAMRHNVQGTYNTPHITFLTDAILRLTQIVNDDNFRRQSNHRMMKKLNQEADDFFRRNYSRAHLQAIGTAGKMVLALEEYQSLHGSDSIMTLLQASLGMTDLFEGHYASD